MIRLLTNLIDTLGALWILAALAIRSRFNFNSSYWNWRLHTAFPNAIVPGGKVGKLKFALEYARWAYRIQRLR
ncbi:MAG: hypothetical protein JKY43_08935 [Phycisphaerales bacterium]|nr:hypothetical protein [Phycisphaerales bacterium]